MAEFYNFKKIFQSSYVCSCVSYGRHQFEVLCGPAHEYHDVGDMLPENFHQTGVLRAASLRLLAINAVISPLRIQLYVTTSRSPTTAPSPRCCRECPQLQGRPSLRRHQTEMAQQSEFVEDVFLSR